MEKIVGELMSQRAFRWTPDRKYQHFNYINSTLLEDFDLQDMFRWIDKHKKNIELSRRARQVTYCVFLKHHLQVKYTRASEYILNGLVALQMDVLVFLKGFGV